ncbi:MAG: glutaredoxin domain-containing protein [Arenicellales bacterium]
MQTKLKALFLLSIGFGLNVGAAEIYKWVGEDGQIHYGNARQMRDRSERIEMNISSYEHVDISNRESTYQDKVVMYSTSWCGYCKQARRHFQANNIDYIEFDIEKNRKAKRAYDKLGGRGVPVILVGNQRMNGFNKASFDRLYARR